MALHKTIRQWLSKNRSLEKTHSYKRAVQSCRKLYARFNAAKTSQYTDNELDFLQLLTPEDFIKDVVGEVSNVRVQSLRYSVRLSFAKSIAWRLYLYTLDPKNVIILYEQAVQNNKISMDFGRWGIFSCNQTLLVANKLFLRFKCGHRTFWLIQHFDLYGIYFPAERIHFSLRAKGSSISKIVHMTGLLHTLLFEHFDKLVEWDSIRHTPSFAGLLLSYRRPFHYFIDILAYADSLISNSTILKQHLMQFITAPKACFFMPYRIFGSQCKTLYFDNKALNAYLIANNAFVITPVQNVNKQADSFSISKTFYQKMIDCSQGYALEDARFKKILEQAKLASPLLWLNVSDEHRSWIENSEAICKIVNYFKQVYPDIGLIIDGLTTPEDIARNDFLQGPASGEEAILTNISKQLPLVKIFNAIGLKSYEKIALASEADFFISCFLTDSLYVAHFHSKPGLGYGPASADLIKHRHPMTVVLPKTKVTDLYSENSKMHCQIGLRYSINPGYMATTAFKVFQLYENLQKHEDNIEMKFSGLGYLLTKNYKSNSIMITSNTGREIDICAGENFYTPACHCSALAYPIKSRKYLLRFEAFSKMGTVLYVYAYKSSRQIFKSSFEAGRAKYITFPADATHFRLFIRLATHDELEFFDIHWNTDAHVGSVRLGGYLDLN